VVGTGDVTRLIKRITYLLDIYANTSLEQHTSMYLGRNSFQRTH